MLIYIAMKAINSDSDPLMLQPLILENIMCYATSYKDEQLWRNFVAVKKIKLHLLINELERTNLNHLA